jgi:hypothetical protein
VSSPEENRFCGGRRGERWESVLYDEYAYIKAKRAATHPFRDNRGAELWPGALKGF